MDPPPHPSRFPPSGGTETITYTEVAGTNTVTIAAVALAGNASAPSNAIDVGTNFVPCG
jgi:hypothetical protein